MLLERRRVAGPAESRKVWKRWALSPVENHSQHLPSRLLGLKILLLHILRAAVFPIWPIANCQLLITNCCSFVKNDFAQAHSHQTAARKNAWRVRPMEEMA
jgi:hypothetical protein